MPRLTPTDNLPVLSSNQPAELCRQGATLSLANRSSSDPDHILHGQLTKLQAASKERLKSRRPRCPIDELDVVLQEYVNARCLYS